MATTTTTTTRALEFKSYKGGERRAEGDDGSVYSIKREGDDLFAASVRLPGEKKFTPLGGGTGKAVREAVDAHYAGQAAEDHRAPTFVQAGSGTPLAEVLESIPDPDRDAEVAQAVKQGSADGKAIEFTAKLIGTQVHPGEGNPAKAVAKASNGKAKRAMRNNGMTQVEPVGALVFEPFKGDEDDQRAKGARHAYKITHAESGGFYVMQRTVGWTNVAGKCDTFEQAEDLANRYERGARQLSHRAFAGLPYAKAIAKLDGEGK